VISGQQCVVSTRTYRTHSTYIERSTKQLIIPRSILIRSQRNLTTCRSSLCIVQISVASVARR